MFIRECFDDGSVYIGRFGLEYDLVLSEHF